MTVTVTVNTNSYVSVADCTLYLANRLYAAAYTAATADEKSQAVIMATRAIDRSLLKGRKYIDTQTLAFPRCYTVDPRAPYAYYDNTPMTWGNGWYSQSAVPQAVIDATCEEALAILTNGNSDRMTLQRQGVTAFSLGNLSETYGNLSGVAPSSLTQSLLSTEARELMRQYRSGAVSIT